MATFKEFTSLFLFCLLLLLARQSVGQKPECCRKALTLFEKIRINHVNKIELNDEFSRRVFYNVFLSIDPYNIYFSKENIEALETLETSIDDALLKNNGTFLTAVSHLIQKSLAEYLQFAESSLKNPLTFSVEDSLSFAESRVDSFDLVNYRLKIFKSQVLKRIYEVRGQQVQPNDFRDLESKARRQLLLRERQLIHKMLNPRVGFQRYLCDLVLQAIAKSSDPYTEFFSEDKMKSFQQSLSSESLSFGFGIEQDVSKTYKVSIVAPGGPAWHSNEIHKGDKVIFASLPSGDTIDFYTAEPDEVHGFFNDPAILEASFQFLDNENKSKTVSLRKHKIEQHENTIKAFVLNGAIRVGYISLPGFYTEWNGEEGTKCSSDVAREILKLKKENISGIILDLRYNGGGSVEEAINLAGLFIDAGPLAQYRQRGDTIITIKDYSRGVVYSGPMIVMINGFSASASELIALTLKRYNRAILVGTTSFGKATSQTLVPLIDGSYEPDQEFVKITSGKLYDLNGQSYQQTGINPHIILPDISSSYSKADKELYDNFNLPVDSILRKIPFTGLRGYPIQQLSSRSEERFRDKANIVNQIDKIVQVPIPLDPEGYFKYSTEIHKLFENLQRIESPPAYLVKNISFDESLLSIDDYRYFINNQVIKEIENSVYVREAFLLLCDYHKINQN